MINPAYYNQKNSVDAAPGVSYYPPRPPTIVLEVSQQNLVGGQSLSDVSLELFGVNQQHYWTILADINILQHPDDWTAGDTLLIPRIIVQDTYI